MVKRSKESFLGFISKNDWFGDILVPGDTFAGFPKSRLWLHMSSFWHGKVWWQLRDSKETQAQSSEASQESTEVSKWEEWGLN